MTSTNDTTPAATLPAPKKRSKRKWVVAAILAVGVIGGIAAATSGGSATPAATPAAASETVAAPTAPGIGTAVRDGKFEFVVQSVAPGVPTVGSEYLNTKAQGEFVLVTVKVTNTSDEPQTFFGSSTKALDSAGRTMEPDTSAAIYLPDSNTLVTPINPGNSVVGTLVFDVPVGSTLASIELHDSAFSGGVTVQL